MLPYYTETHMTRCLHCDDKFQTKPRGFDRHGLYARVRGHSKNHTVGEALNILGFTYDKGFLCQICFMILSKLISRKHDAVELEKQFRALGCPCSSQGRSSRSAARKRCLNCNKIFEVGPNGYNRESIDSCVKGCNIVIGDLLKMLGCPMPHASPTFICLPCSDLLGSVMAAITTIHQLEEEMRYINVNLSKNMPCLACHTCFTDPSHESRVPRTAQKHSRTNNAATTVSQAPKPKKLTGDMSESDEPISMTADTSQTHIVNTIATCSSPNDGHNTMTTNSPQELKPCMTGTDTSLTLMPCTMETGTSLTPFPGTVPMDMSETFEPNQIPTDRSQTAIQDTLTINTSQTLNPSPVVTNRSEELKPSTTSTYTSQTRKPAKGRSSLKFSFIPAAKILISNRRYRGLFNLLTKHSAPAYIAFQDRMAKTVRTEVQNYIKMSNNIASKKVNVKNIMDFSWPEVVKEYATHMPVLCSVVEAALTNKRVNPRPVVREDGGAGPLMPAFGNIISTCLYLRRRNKCNFVPTVHGIELWKAGMTQRTLSNFYLLGMSSNIKRIKCIIKNLAKNADKQTPDTGRTDQDKQVTTATSGSNTKCPDQQQQPGQEDVEAAKMTTESEADSSDDYEDYNDSDEEDLTSSSSEESSADESNSPTATDEHNELPKENRKKRRSLYDFVKNEHLSILRTHLKSKPKKRKLEGGDDVKIKKTEHSYQKEEHQGIQNDSQHASDETQVKKTRDTSQLQVPWKESFDTGARKVVGDEQMELDVTKENGCSNHDSQTRTDPESI